MQRLSTYAEDLPSDAKARYREKLEVIGGNDPFLSGRIGEVVYRLPDLDALDLVSYLVLQTSFTSAKQFQARKGLEAYNQFVCGWVKDVCSRLVCGKYLITSRRGVRHDSESRRRPQESLESIKESWNYGNLKRNQLCN